MTAKIRLSVIFLLVVDYISSFSNTRRSISQTFTKLSSTSDVIDAIEITEFRDDLQKFLSVWKSSSISLDPECAYTILAPTDSAFDKHFSKDNKLSYVNGSIPNEVQDILMYHIVDGFALTTENFEGSKLFPTKCNQLLAISISSEDQNMIINNIPIHLTNIPFSYGIIHIIDTLLIPETPQPKYETSIPPIDTKLSPTVQRYVKRTKRRYQTTHSIQTHLHSLPRRNLWSRVIQMYMRILSRKNKSVIDGSMPGDLGFDPFGIANSIERLNRMREIELKHARIAMLATLIWPISELFYAPLREVLRASGVHMQTLQLDDTYRALTVLNGGLLTGPNSAAFGLFMLFFSATEYWLFTNRSSLSSKKTGPQPGDFGFDPLNLLESKGSSPQSKFRLKELELFNGRIAMLAIVEFALVELTTGKAVVDITPFFFRPIWDTWLWR